MNILDAITANKNHRVRSVRIEPEPASRWYEVGELVELMKRPTAGIGVLEVTREWECEPFYVEVEAEARDISTTIGGQPIIKLLVHQTEKLPLKLGGIYKVRIEVQP